MSRLLDIAWVSRIPITLLLIVVVLSLRIGVDARRAPEQPASQVFRELGALTIQESPAHSELFGPFDLWSGEWWRVPLNGLHHASWWHLIFVVLGMIYLGILLEPRLRWATYLVFLTGALLATTIPRWEWGEAIPRWFIGLGSLTGFSGVLFAQFGMLLLLRRNDRGLTKQFGDDGILLVAACGLGCLALSTVGLATRLDNIAHLVGLGYGLAWGVGISANQPIKGLFLTGVLAAHLLLISVFDQLIHPTENGRYHWWLAETTTDAQLKQRHYRAAVKADPALEFPWLAIAVGELQNGQPSQAWRTLLKGLNHHPSMRTFSMLSQEIWDEFSTPTERLEAWAAVGRMFPRDGERWRRDLLSPRQAALFRLEQGESVEAWTALMRQLRERDPDSDPDLTRKMFPAETELANLIWPTLKSRAERLQAMDALLEENRRAWHLAVIPRRDLIPYYQDIGESFWAWQLLLTELKADPGFHAEGKRLAAEIWKTFPTELRRNRARQMVQDIFGLEGFRWQMEFNILSDKFKEKYRLDQSVKLPPDPPMDFPQQLPPPNPNDPTSAAAGITL